MKKYIIAARKQQYIVDAENEFRAIQAVLCLSVWAYIGFLLAYRG